MITSRGLWAAAPELGKAVMGATAKFLGQQPAAKDEK